MWYKKRVTNLRNPSRGDLTDTELDFINIIAYSLLEKHSYSFSTGTNTLSNAKCAIDKVSSLGKPYYIYYLGRAEFKTYYEHPKVLNMFADGLLNWYNKDKEAKQTELRKALDANAS